MSKPEAPVVPEFKNQEELQRFAGELEADIRKLSDAMHRIDADAHERTLVITSLKELEPTRRCTRQVGMVLLEKTVADIIPQLEQEVAGISAEKSRVAKMLEGKEAQNKALYAKYGVYNNQQSRGGAQGGNDEGAAAAKSKGVLA